MPDVIAPVAARYERLLPLTANDQVRDLLQRALAELHTLGGWCCYDMHLTDTATWHYGQAITLASAAGDVLGAVDTARHQAVGWRELGAPNDALKLLQMALMRLGDVSDGVPGKVEHEARLHGHAARALADLGRADHAREEQIRAARLPEMGHPYDRAHLEDSMAALNLAISQIQGDTRLRERCLDVAEHHAATAVRTFAAEELRDSAPARIRLATIHALDGQPDTPRLAVAALDAVQGLRSVRARALLVPLEEALRTRRDSTSQDLAHRARAVRQGT